MLTRKWPWFALLALAPTLAFSASPELEARYARIAEDGNTAYISNPGFDVDSFMLCERVQLQNERLQPEKGYRAARYRAGVVCQGPQGFLAIRLEGQSFGGGVGADAGVGVGRARILSLSKASGPYFCRVESGSFIALTGTWIECRGEAPDQKANFISFYGAGLGLGGAAINGPTSVAIVGTSPAQLARALDDLGLSSP